MGKLRFKLSHVIARSWFARLRRAYRLKPGVQLHSLVPFAVGSSSIAANNMSFCSGRSSWSDDVRDDDDSLALLKNQNKAEDMAELHKWITARERERRLSLKQKPDKQGKKKKVSVYPLGSYKYNSWCRREAPKNVDESCHCSIPSKRKKGKKIEMTKAGEESEEAWEREGFWSVIAQVGDAKIVRKKVVLKKRMNRGSGAHPAVGVMEGQRAPVNSDNSEDDDRNSAALAAKDKDSTQQQPQRSASSSSSSCSCSSSACNNPGNNFRLSTSSSFGNASLLGADVLAWEKEQYSPFAASDKSSNTDHALGAVSKGAFLFVGHDQTVERDCSTSSSLFGVEEHLQENVKGLCCRKSPSRSSSKHRRWESSCCFEQQQGDANLEASTRAWDDNLGVITSALLLRRHANDDGDGVPSRRRLSFEKESWYEDYDYEGGGGGGESGRARVGESVAVSMLSSDPYSDFKQSMMQMIVEKRLFKAVELEELLERYLCLNSPGYHGLIVQVFSDLWSLEAFSKSRQAVA